MLSGPPVTATIPAEALLEKFQAASDRQRRSLISQLQQRFAELLPLLESYLARLDPQGDDWGAGLLIQLLLGEPSPERDAFLARYPAGWLKIGRAHV